MSILSDLFKKTKTLYNIIKKISQLNMPLEIYNYNTNLICNKMAFVDSLDKHKIAKLITVSDSQTILN